MVCPSCSVIEPQRHYQEELKRATRCLTFALRTFLPSRFRSISPQGGVWARIWNSHPSSLSYTTSLALGCPSAITHTAHLIVVFGTWAVCVLVDCLHGSPVTPTSSIPSSTHHPPTAPYNFTFSFHSFRTALSPITPLIHICIFTALPYLLSRFPFSLSSFSSFASLWVFSPSIRCACCHLVRAVALGIELRRLYNFKPFF